MTILICEGNREQVFSEFTADQCVDLDRRGVKVVWTDDSQGKPKALTERKPGPKRQLTREDVAFTLELMSEGVPTYRIARWVFGLDPDVFRDRLRTWGVYDKRKEATTLRLRNPFSDIERGATGRVKQSAGSISRMGREAG